jgi:DinB superfamily
MRVVLCQTALRRCIVKNELQRLVSDVETTRALVLQSVANLAEHQAAFKIAPDAWSCTEVIEHLYLAEVSGIAKIWSAADALRAGNGWTGESPHRGKSIEQIIEETWKPTETAPPIATPHIGGPIRFWRSAFRSLTPVIADLGAYLDGQPLQKIVFPHFISGPLDAEQRLQFLRYHMERHIAQIDRVKAHPAFPGDARSL